jgi:hypothetical protein
VDYIGDPAPAQSAQRLKSMYWSPPAVLTVSVLELDRGDHAGPDFVC